MVADGLSNEELIRCGCGAVATFCVAIGAATTSAAPAAVAITASSEMANIFTFLRKQETLLADPPGAVAGSCVELSLICLMCSATSSVGLLTDGGSP